MKFVKTLVTAGLLSIVAAQGDQTGTTYESVEKERFIYGKPGDEGYGEPMTADDLMELEQMWVLDGEAQKWRGFVQGFHRGLYKEYEWELQETCLNRETVKQMYYIKLISSSFDFSRMIDLVGLFWNVYYNVDS